MSSATAHTIEGARLRVRPLTVADRDRLAAAFGRLSARSRQLRFLGPKPRLSDAELTYLTDIDHRLHEALVAVDPASCEIVAVARYATERGTTSTADVAVVVADAWQGRGVGTMLTRALLPVAAANGIERLTATTAGENHIAQRMLRTLGFRVRAIEAGVVDVELDLRCATPPCLAAAA